MYGYIYETTNLINGKKYIGQSRGKFKSWYLGSGKIIKKAIDKYGKENFSIKLLKYAKTKKELNILEKELIEHYGAKELDTFYNLHEGGIGGDTFSGKHHTEKAKRRMSKSKKGKPSPHKGKNFRPLTNEEKLKKCLSSPLRTPIIVNGKKYPSFNSASKDLHIRIGRPSIQFYRNKGYDIIVPGDPVFG